MFKLILVILIFFSSFNLAQAEPTLMLKQIVKLSGPRLVYINSQGLQIINQKQHVEIVAKLPKLEVCFINQPHKLYFICSLKTLPPPRGYQLIKMLIDNGDCINKSEFWIKYKYCPKLNYTLYRFKSNPTNDKQISVVGQLKLGNFKNINLDLLKVLNKITYLPDLGNIILEISSFNTNANIENLIETNLNKYINYEINYPDLKQLKKAKSLNDIFEYESNSDTLNGFTNFVN